ncbi:MAG: enoyl-CoA hydratase-related protein [Acidimicrobiia bacterium]|nr:enoyl-CoA hydratase-related protein [Acidimicrobiia bacterium]
MTEVANRPPSDGPAAERPAVRYEVDAGVATITIDRPEARNAINRAVRDGLWAAFDTIAADDAIKVAILTGAGDRAFSAGADLKEMAETKMAVPSKRGIPHLGRNVQLDIPVIAAVNGFALAGGFWLAQQCDLCYAAEHAQFGISEAKWSRGAPWAGPLPWLIPPRVAMELLVTAEPISARRAYELGLVNAVLPRAELMAEVRRVAAVIAGNAPLTVRAGKALVYRTMGLSWLDSLEEGDRIYEPVYLSEDAQEGPRAFAEKRAPIWKGR